MSEIESKGLSLKKIETSLTWKKLLLSSAKMNQVKKLETWLNELGNENDNKSKNHLALLHGPSGTGKTLTASLLGKYTNRDVYRVDLSTITSEYIGETEKNLEQLFAQATDKDWILLFDEADALFGKRTEVEDTHDKHANRDATYLLQRMKKHVGLVILSTKLKENIDEASVELFDSIIEFEELNFIERIILCLKKILKK